MPRLPVLLACALLAAAPLAATEHATYNSGGALTALIHDGAEIPLDGEIVVSFAGGVHATLQPHDQRSPIAREGSHWHGVTTFPNGGQAQFDGVWTERDDTVSLAATVTSGGPSQPGAPTFRFPLLVDSVDYVLDVPRDWFVGGRLEPADMVIPAVNSGEPGFFRDTTAALTFVDARQNWTLALTLDRPHLVTVTDRWDTAGRSYRVRIQLGSGVWAAGDALKFGLTLRLAGTPHAAAAHLAIDPSKKLFPFDGFGGDYCFQTQTPAADYTLDHLHQAWARLEFKAMQWDRERHSQPDAALVRDFELMQRIQKMGLPWILSLWRLPERFYTDPNRKPFGTFFRQIAPERWPEFLDLLGSYLQYLKNNYGAEPDYFSFNESDLGVDIGFTPEGHRDAIERIGAYLASLGLKTKMLAGDTANPRDSHKFVLPTAADPAALRYVGALSVHSWGGGTPAQYHAWRDLAAWLHFPLVVAEAGTDPGSWRNRIFDSYAYGLGEMRQYQELLREMQPQAIVYWQFTEDYGLVHVGPDGKIEPTGRFYLIQHFTNLTPRKCEAVTSDSDQPDVLVSAFAKGRALTIHILNVGPTREATITGLPSGHWRTVVTTETESFKKSASGPSADGRLTLPARSLTSLLKD